MTQLALSLVVALVLLGPWLPARANDYRSAGSLALVLPNPINPAGGTNSTVTAGGTAIIAVTGPANGCAITNPPNAASQGIGTAENAYVNPTGATPGSTDGAANGTTILLAPNTTWNCPGAVFPGQTVLVNAATSGHKLTVLVWSVVALAAVVAPPPGNSSALDFSMAANSGFEGI